MVTQFNDGKKLIMDLIDQSTVAFDQRQELCTKLTVLKDRNENDKVMHIQEMREMQRRLEHDAKLQKFFDIKGQKRLNPELEQRELDKKQNQKENYERQLFEYKEIIDRIKQLYGEDDPERLVAQFKRQEDENFALFNYVNELSHEVEVLNDTTQELTDEIGKLGLIYTLYLNAIWKPFSSERQKSEQTEKELKQKTEALDYLNAELERIEELAKETSEKKQNLSSRLQQLLKGIEDIFKYINP